MNPPSLFATFWACALLSAGAPVRAATLPLSPPPTPVHHHTDRKEAVTTRVVTKSNLGHPLSHVAPRRGALLTAATRATRHPAHHTAIAHAVMPPVQAAPVRPAVAAAAAVPNPAKGTDSGLPLPRFAALRSDQVSLRAGPGTRYPIDWIYQRRDLPVKIEREFEVWRLVSQPDGTRGWVHEAMLTGRRGLLITGDQPQTLRAAAAETASPVAIVKPGVVGRLLSCPAGTDWCQAQVKTYKGWLPRTAFWGTLPNETVGP